MLDTFSFGVSSNLSQQKSSIAENIGIVYFLRTIVPRKYMPIMSAVGFFCCDKFKENPNEKVSNMSKLTKFYFNTSINFSFSYGNPSLMCLCRNNGTQ